MTFVGKLLVILNLAMATCFMAFAIAVYNAREDLRGKIEAKDKQIRTLQSEKATAEAKAEELDKKIKDTDAALAKLQQETTAKIQDLGNQVTQLDGELQTARAEANAATASLKVATTEQVQRQKEVEALRALRDEYLKKNSDLITKNTDLTDQAAQLKNELELTTNRLEELDNRHKQLSEYVVRRQGTLPDETQLATGGDAPPPPNVEGVVLRVDPTGKYLEISIGDDDGIKKDQVLEVWRTKPTGKYLGQIKITKTQATTAIAKPVSVTGLIQENDQVGPRIPVHGN